MGGIFAQSTMDLNAANMYNGAPKDSDKVKNISYVLHYLTPGGTQRDDVIISLKMERGTFLLNYVPSLHEKI